ncbi:DUF2264 domain-containing protein [Niabella aquatica]
MMRNNKILVLLFMLLLFSPPVIQAQQKDSTLVGKSERDYCIKILVKIADPVLNALSRNELKKAMPVEAAVPTDRVYSTYLEAFGRLLAGIAPWLELGPDNTAEGKLRERYINLTLKCIDNATNPQSPDFLNFSEGRQPLVDAAFFAQGILRAPTQLWERLSEATKQHVIKALKSSRGITPSYSNWLMFSAMVEAFLEKFDKSGDKMRLDYAIKQHSLWYKGDGTYGDGPDFHWDYYNSFVIQPMLLEVLQVMKDSGIDSKKEYGVILTRARRYAAVQERLISPEATYPVIGRSITYRFGAFQLLSKVALMRQLPAEVNPQQVRYALYSVIKRQIEAPGTFDEKGWLRIGFFGHQPNLGERYISTGSLYLCTQAFLILGLPANDVFWTAPDKDWTNKRIWKGDYIEIDHAITDNS